MEKAAGLKEVAYQVIRDRIVSCAMAPGSVISESALARDLDTSRTPVREALLRLQREGLVDIYPRKGTFVSPISIREIHDIAQLRLFIEPAAARTVCRTLSRDELSRYRGLFAESPGSDPESFTEWFSADRAFHRWIVAATGNRILCEIYDNVMDRSQRVRILSGSIPHRVERANREHLDLIDALDRCDEDAVTRTMRAHIIASRDESLQLGRELSV